jgi:enoyl-CoA hydratase/carnithine racemase
VRRAEMYNVYGDSVHNLGVIKMNREHRYNTLTPQLIDDIIRGVDTMNGDSFRHAIYLTTDKHEHWSNGTDFRTIAHMKKEDQFGRIQEYMR